MRDVALLFPPEELHLSSVLRFVRSLHMLLLWSALATLLILAGCGGSASTSSATTSGATCRSDQLDLVREHSGIATGHIGVEVAFHNHGSSACSLSGYPGVQLLDAQGHAATTHLQQAISAYTYKNQKVQTVSLASGALAYFKLEWEDMSVEGCVSSSSADITPPGGSSALTLGLQDTACNGSLTTSPVEPSAF